MQSLKQDLLAALVLCAIAVVIALAWGSPFIQAGTAHAQMTGRLQPFKPKPHPGTAGPPANR